MTHAQAEIQRLRDRVDELEALLGLREQCAANIFKGQHRSRILTVAKLLLARELVSRTAILLAIGGADRAERSCDVYIHYARAQLKPLGITVQNEFGRGWFVAASEKSKLRTVLTVKPLTDAQRSEGER